MTEELRKTQKIGLSNSDGKNSGLELEQGQIINSRYRIIENIGSGGFGTVFRATDLLLNKDVALKFLDPEIRDNKKKFIRVQREINTSQKISDERVVKIFGIEYMNDTPFLIMEFIKGVNLKTFINKKKFLKWAEFKPLFIEILNGIKSLHDKNIIHRDIKPSNIIITSDGNIKIIDFGLSKELSDTEKTSSLGEMIGSPKYMSPEQIKGVKLDHTSDIYQLGLILYYIITQETNEKSDSSTIEQLMERINSDPRKVYRFNSPVSRFVKFGIYKSIETEKKFRFTSVKEMIDYFNAENFVLLKYISNIFLRKKMALISSLIIIVLILLSGFLYLENSGVVSELDFHGNDLKAYNSFGFELFRENFSEMNVINALPVKIDSNFKRLRMRGSKESYVNKDMNVSAVFLSKRDLYKDITKLSINSDKFSSKVILLDKEGKSVYSKNFHMVNDLNIRTLFSGWMDFIEIASDDINTDGRDEIHFYFYQNMSMYPSGFCILDNKDFHSIYNSGHIEKTYFYKTEKNRSNVLLIGRNNPFCHFRFICDLEYSTFSDIRLPPMLNKSINKTSFMFPIMFIPYKTRIQNNNWDTSGEISFISQIDDKVFTLNREWELTISDKNGKTTYRDNIREVSDMFYYLNAAYRKKMERRSAFDPGSEIESALKLNISNPVYKSLINYYAGDLFLSAGYYSEAEKYFNISHKFLPENFDINQKMAELYFLSENISELENEIEKNSTGFSGFYGLGNFGIKLFQIYVNLHTGNFRAASDLSGDYKKATGYIEGMSSIFNGDYENAFIESSRLIGRRTTPFTLSEARLLYSKTVLLNYFFNKKSDLIDHKDMKLADFYFSDIAVNSLPDGHLAAMSRAYFMALNGDHLNAEKYADETLAKLLQESSGDMNTRLWLFYDSFIYGKIMEITGNKTKAVRGYKISFRSNPFSDLGVRSKSKIKILKSENI